MNQSQYFPLIYLSIYYIMFGQKSIILFTVLCIAFCHYKQAPYAEWAHSHVVWINGVEQN